MSVVALHFSKSWEDYLHVVEVPPTGWRWRYINDSMIWEPRVARPHVQQRTVAIQVDGQKLELDSEVQVVEKVRRRRKRNCQGNENLPQLENLNSLNRERETQVVTVSGAMDISPRSPSPVGSGEIGLPDDWIIELNLRGVPPTPGRSIDEDDLRFFLEEGDEDELNAVLRDSEAEPDRKKLKECCV